jgi:hypothetical protein
VRRDHEPLCVGQIGLVSRDGAAMRCRVFGVHDIDGEMLGRLTNDDLKDIGVASFGRYRFGVTAACVRGG